MARMVTSKVVSGSPTDLVDVVQLLKLGRVDVEGVSRRLAGEDLLKFQALVKIARYERRGHPKKGRRILVALLAKSVGLNLESLELPATK
jgi:hypothetical protein